MSGEVRGSTPAPNLPDADLDAMEKQLADATSGEFIPGGTDVLGLLDDALFSLRTLREERDAAQSDWINEQREHTEAVTRAERAEAELALRDDDLRVERERVRQYEERYRAIEAERDRLKTALDAFAQTQTVWMADRERLEADNTALREALCGYALREHIAEHLREHIAEHRLSSEPSDFDTCAEPECARARSLLSQRGRYFTTFYLVRYMSW